MGTLRLEVGKVAEAYDAFQQAIKNCNQLLELRPDDQRALAVKITAKFNLGCWFEQNFRLGDASEQFKQVVQLEPSYVDAYLKLSQLARDRGDVKRAVELIEEAKRNQIKKPEQFALPVNQGCLKGKLLSDVSELDKAYEEFKFVADKLCKGDSYALVGLANINYEQSTRCRENLQHQEMLLKKAMDKYVNVLEIDEANAYAALGVANVLAEHNKLSEALEIYKSLKETCPALAHVLVNQAHLQVEAKNFEGAINLYLKALEKFPGNANLEVELFLSKAYFKMGAFEKCKKLLNCLVHRHPNDVRLRFNLALCLMEQAMETFNKQFRKVAETKEAVKQLHQSERLVLHLLRLRHADQFSLNLPQNMSRDAVEQQRLALGRMVGVCEEKLKYIREMI